MTATVMIASVSANPTAVFTAHICATDNQVKYVNDGPLSGGLGVDMTAIGVAGTVNSFTITDDFEDAGGFIADARSPETGIVAGGGTVSAGTWATGQLTMTHRIPASSLPITTISVQISGASVSTAGECRLPCCKVDCQGKLPGTCYVGWTNAGCTCEDVTTTSADTTTPPTTTTVDDSTTPPDTTTPDDSGDNTTPSGDTGDNTTPSGDGTGAPGDDTGTASSPTASSPTASSPSAGNQGPGADGGDANPGTGVALAIIPTLVAAGAAVVASRKRK